MAEKVYNVYGKAYGEYKDAFIRTFIVTAEDEDGCKVNLYAIHQMVCLGNRRFFDSVIVFYDELFDSGVCAYDIDVNGYGLDDGDFDGMLRDLVVETILGKGNYKPSDDVARRIFDSVRYEYTCDGKSDAIKKAMFHYDNVA